MMNLTMLRHGAKTSVAMSLAVLLGAALIVPACGAFTADTTPANADGGGGADGATATGDGGSGGEAGSTEAGSTGFCAMHTSVALCSDFDGPNELAGWNVDVTAGGSSLQTDAKIFRSAPRSLRSALAGAMITDARLTRPIPRAAKRVRVSFEVQLVGGALQTGQQISIAEIYCGGTALDKGAYVFVEEPAGLVAAYAGDSASTRTGLSPLNPNDWTPIVLDARFGLDPVVVVTVAGTSSAPLPIAKTCATLPLFEVRLGLSTYTTVTAQGFLDNVLFEVDPTGP
jgi:hypothetical protein